MKKLFLLLMGSLLTLFSCEVEHIHETPAIRRIINETDYPIEIMVNGDIDTFIYNLSSHDTLDIKGKCYEGGTYEACILDWISIAYGSIIFNNERVQKFDISSSSSLYYTGRAINSSVYNPYSYELIEDTPELRIYQYKITQTDYNTAEIL